MTRHASRFPCIKALSSTLTQTNDLIQALTYLRKQTIGQCPERVGFGAAQMSVEGLGLMAEHIAGLPCLAPIDLPDRHGKRVVGVVSTPPPP